MSDAASRAGEGVAGIFGRAAATYDRVGPRRFTHFGERLVEIAGPAAGAQVLDVAVGRGAVMFPAARRVGSRGRVIGTDITPEMLRETAREIQGAGLENVELRQMDAGQLEFPDGAFDWVLCGFALWFFPDPQRALQEFYRVLKPGGHLGLTTWALDSPIHVMMRSQVAPDAGFAGGTGTQRFDTRERLEAALPQPGFKELRVFAEDQVFVLAEAEPLWDELWSTGVRRHLEKMTPSALAQAKADYLQKLETLRQADGIHVTYRALFAFATKPRQVANK